MPDNEQHQIMIQRLRLLLQSQGWSMTTTQITPEKIIITAEHKLK